MSAPALILGALALAAGAAVPGGAALAAGGVDTVTLRAETSHLDRGQAPWQERSLSWRHAWAPRHGVELGVAATRRFGQDDERLALGYAVPLSPAVGLALEAAWSPTHRVLARAAAGARLSWEFEPQWLLHGGLRASAYDDASVRQASLALERYVGAFSVEAAWMPARALGASTASASLRGHWHYADGASVGLSLAAGREAARVGAGALALAEVRAAALVGRHPLAAHWSLGYALERARQGDFYTRTGASLALQHSF